jgi:CO dehydrogenase/acetyl-CoA synthase beta subunit
MKEKKFLRKLMNIMNIWIVTKHGQQILRNSIQNIQILEICKYHKYILDLNQFKLVWKKLNQDHKLLMIQLQNLQISTRKLKP